MVQVNTLLKVTDITGVRIVYCIRILGSSYKKRANIGDIIIVVVKKRKHSSSFFKKAHVKRRYAVGKIHRALVTRSKYQFKKKKNF